MSFIRTSIIGTDALGQRFRGEQTVRLNDGTLAVHPFGFDGVEPGALFGQKQWQNTHATAFRFRLLVVLTYPRAYQLTCMPGGIVPDEQPCRFALSFQFFAALREKLCGDGTHWTPIDKPQEHLIPNGGRNLPSLPQHPITGQRFGVGIVLLPTLLNEAHRLLLVLPAMRFRQGEAAPPDFIQEADGPGGDLLLLRGPGQQSVASSFFSWYNGSGLVIQCFARFQLIPRRWRVWRMVSMLTGWLIQPRRTHCLTSSFKVHKLVSNPKSRGGRCSTTLKASASISSARAVRNWWGRLEWTESAARPC